MAYGPMLLPEVASIRRWLLLILGLAFFYFYSGGGPNQGSRFNLDRAILQEQRLTIDSYAHNTEDKAFYQGHYYCDKAPGASFVALPMVYVTRVAQRFVGMDPNHDQSVAAQMRVATWTASGLPALLMCLGVFTWVLRQGYPPAAAVLSSIAVGLASPMWAYATLFWGNALASCCLVYAASGVDKLIHAPPSKAVLRTAFFTGLAAGGAVLAEYPTAPMVATLALLLLVKQRPWSEHLTRLSAFALGGIGMALVLGAYNFTAFGSAFHLGYASVQGFTGMKQGLFGITLPTAEALSGILWGPRGLLLTGPFIVLGLVGHGLALVTRRHLTMTIACIALSVYPVLLNASYAYWDGGWTYGPRHMSTALPFLAMGFAPLYRACGPRLRNALWFAAALGIFIPLMGVSVHGMTPYEPRQPFVALYWRSFVVGNFARHTGWVETGGPATNLGIAFGIAKPQSLLPYFLASLVAVVGLSRTLRRCPVR